MILLHAQMIHSLSYSTMKVNWKRNSKIMSLLFMQLQVWLRKIFVLEERISK